MPDFPYGRSYPEPDEWAIPNTTFTGIEAQEPPDVDDHHVADWNPNGDKPAYDQPPGNKPAAWQPVSDLGPHLRGEIKPVTPTVGAYRTDGQRLLYPGLEHSVIAHTAAGKTWFALLCAAAEMLAGNTVVYLHFEESTPASTVERLQRIGIPADTIDRLLLFAAPSRPLRPAWLDPLLAVQATLVIIDGVNEAMVLHGAKIDLEGWSAVRRRVVVPFKEVGAGRTGMRPSADDRRPAPWGRLRHRP